MQVDKKHSVFISENTVNINGVESVVSLFDKEVEVNTVAGRVTVSGQGLNATKLAVDEGVINLSADKIFSVKYGETKKFALNKIFK